MSSVSFKIERFADSFLSTVFIILSGGFQDAYTYMCRGKVFANAQTGNIVLLSDKIFRGDFRAGLKYLVPVISFLLGTVAAEIIRYNAKKLKLIHFRQAVLVFETAVLFSVGFIPGEYDIFANAAVSFVCALQLQSFPTLRGQAFASTMCVGNMKNAAVYLSSYIKNKDKKHLEISALYFAVVTLFGLGAALGSFAAEKFGLKSIFGSCILLIISFIIFAERKEA